MPTKLGSAGTRYNFKDFKIPGAEMAGDFCKKNLEFWGLMSKVSLEVCGGIAKLQTAFLEQLRLGIGDMIENGMSPSEAVSKMSDIARNGMVEAIKNSQHISDILTAANNDVVSTVCSRFCESMKHARNGMK